MYFPCEENSCANWAANHFDAIQVESLLISFCKGCCITFYGRKVTWKKDPNSKESNHQMGITFRNDGVWGWICQNTWTHWSACTGLANIRRLETQFNARMWHLREILKNLHFHVNECDCIMQILSGCSQYMLYVRKT